MDEHTVNKKEVFILNKLRLAITDACNLSCFYCHNEGQCFNCNPTFMSLDYVKNIVKWILDNNVAVDFINITGGEPLLHKNLVEILDELCKLKCKIRLNTNATLLNKNKIDELKKHGVYSLKIGIDSIFAKQTKPNIYITKPNIKNIIENIKYASTKMGVVLNTVITKFNYKNIDEMVNFARELKLPRIKIIRLNDVNSRKLNDDDTISEDFKTNQPEANWYYYFFTKYVTSANKTINNPHKGRTDLYYDDGFQIRLCDDVCTTLACGNMYTEITAHEEVLICQKRHIAKKVDFSKSFEEVNAIISSANNKMCNALTGQKSLIRYIK